MRKRKVLILVLLLAVAVASAAYVSLLDYPRIVRSAYYRNPRYALKAVVAEYRGKKVLSKSEALERVRQAGLTPVGSPRFLCLLDEPKGRGDKPIVDRYFGLLSKLRVEANDTSFWEIPEETGLALVEVSTRRVIHLEGDTSGSVTPKYYPAEGQPAPAL